MKRGSNTKPPRAPGPPPASTSAATPAGKNGTGKTALLSKVRALCLRLEDVSEKSSHGHPAFFFKKKVLAYFLDNHHGDGRLALWLPAEPGAQAMLVDVNSEIYFVPPYVGPAGWIGVRLDRDAEWAEVSSLIEAAHQMLAEKKRHPR